MQITEQWGRALGCDLRATPAHFPTRFDDIEQFHCVETHDCSGAEAAAAAVVRCFHTGGHAWPFTIPMLLGRWYFAELVFDFFEAHPKPAAGHATISAPQ